MRRHAAVADVASWPAVRDAVAEMVEALGPIDILINNAATEGVTSRLEALDPDEWATEQAVNLNGHFSCARATLPAMPAMRVRGWGRILNVTSGPLEPPSGPFPTRPLIASPRSAWTT